MTYYKFLNESLQGKNEFVYPLPSYDVKTKKWIPSEWIEEQEADQDSKEPCGKGLHLMKVLKPLYCRYVVCFEAEGKDLLGEDSDKARFRAVRLVRPITKSEIFHPKANLSRVDLSGADLSGADLSGVDLSGVDLSGANLSRVDLSGANLSGANLSRANLSGANLSGANLSRANLSGVDLSGVDLSESHGIKNSKDVPKELLVNVHC